MVRSNYGTNRGGGGGFSRFGKDQDHDRAIKFLLVGLNYEKALEAERGCPGLRGGVFIFFIFIKQKGGLDRGDNPCSG